MHFCTHLQTISLAFQDVRLGAQLFVMDTASNLKDVKGRAGVRNHPDCQTSARARVEGVRVEILSLIEGRANEAVSGRCKSKLRMGVGGC